MGAMVAPLSAALEFDTKEAKDEAVKTAEAGLKDESGKDLKGDDLSKAQAALTEATDGTIKVVVTPAEAGFNWRSIYRKPVAGAKSTWNKGCEYKEFAIPAVAVAAVAAHFSYIGYTGEWKVVADVLTACVTPWKSASITIMKAHPYMTAEVYAAIGSVVVGLGYKGYKWNRDRK